MANSWPAANWVEEQDYYRPGQMDEGCKCIQRFLLKPYRYVVVKDAGCLNSLSASQYLNLNVICKHVYTLYFWRSVLYYILVKSSIICAHESFSNYSRVSICFAGKIVTIIMQEMWFSSLKLNSSGLFFTFSFSWKWSLPHRQQHHRGCSGNSHSYRWVALLVPAHLLLPACSCLYLLF